MENQLSGPPTEMDEDDKMKQQLLEELLQFSHHGMAKELAAKYGKTMPGEEGEGTPEEEAMDTQEGAPADGEPIPGVETDATKGKGELSPELIKALLAQMAAKGGG